MNSILQRISVGDESAADECVAEYGGMIWRLAKRYLNRADSEIDDAVQEVFVEIWIHADRYDPSKGTEAAFVATLAHRRIIDRQRKISTRRAHERASVTDHNPSSHDPDLPSLSQSGSDHAHLYRKELSEGFSALPESERSALWMSVYKGLSHREISQITEAPVGTVKSRIRRAMLRLTATLKGNSSEQLTEGSTP
ncbi:MAG: sigma-70 family RNA polymerase sigma factor [Phycisphaerales bacterium]|nr:sigma-70 family RNA polymerase sigma factor [Phycisphaerales bacterium]